ncbi:sigma-54-dependent Fis family transcriptional regulator [bacterium]|nr:sigma-54-dependent Fis family transcriptional regulator [bacterium]
MKVEKGTILVIEDDPNQREIIRMILLKEGFYVETAGAGEKALELIRLSPFDLVITDLKLPDMDGTEILKGVKGANLPCHVIIMTAYGSIPSAIEATRLGAFYYLEKPVEKEQLLLVVQNAVNQARLLKDNISLRNQLFDRFCMDNIIGTHGRMQDLFRIVKRVAPTNSNVLIYGESGTGKELFAKSIHYNSMRKEKPFFAINCAAIPETLLESELFGYEKGAFTGALTRHTGLLEQSNGSTLFLDEIGDLSLGTQAKILRAIQEREIRRISGKDNIKLDVRIIAATNKNLKDEIARKTFREDLYYRLNVIAFTIPPLRERATDIPILSEHFLKRLNQTHNKTKGIKGNALQLLIGYSWPGNVRQLESVIERAYVMCEENLIDVEHLPEEVKQGQRQGIVADDGKELIDQLIDARLTGSEYRIYLYLSRQNPPESGTRIKPKLIMERLNISKETFYSGIARLKELGLYNDWMEHT